MHLKKQSGTALVDLRCDSCVAAPATSAGNRVLRTSYKCPDCCTALFRFYTSAGDDLTGCPHCGLGVWSDAPSPQDSLIPELLPDELRWPRLLAMAARSASRR